MSGDNRIWIWSIDATTRNKFFEEVEGAVRNASDYDIVGCSAGFDTYVKDWGGLLTSSDFRLIGSMIASSNRRFFSILEGGYYIPDLGINVRAYLGVRHST